MKNYQILISGFLLLVFLACDERSELLNDESIVGNWDQFETAYSMGGSDLTIQSVKNVRILAIESDGSLSLSIGDEIYQGTWNSTEDILNLDYETGDNLVSVYSFSVENNILKLIQRDSFCSENCYDRYRRI